MEQCKNIDSNLRKLFDKAEELGWTVKVYGETYQNKRTATYAELYKNSPAGEDFSMSIEFGKEEQAETFIRELDSYWNDFDVDEHVEMWLPSRGKRGCPSSIKALVEDAEAIENMIEELLRELEIMEQEEDE